MFPNKHLFIVCAHLAFSTVLAEKEINEDCLRCICVASSECDISVRCHTIGATEIACGPFQITQAYWKEAGSPGKESWNPFDFEDCANDIDCASETVSAYLKNNAKDCNGDSELNCDDLALIHKFGSRKCNKTTTNSKYWKRYVTCVKFNLS